MVHLVIVILFILVATIPSAYSLDIIGLWVSDMNENTYHMRRELTMNTPFTFKIQSNESLLDYRLYCKNKEVPHETFINGLPLIKSDEVDIFSIVETFTLGPSFEPTLSMNTSWRCLLKYNSSTAIKLNFVVIVHPSRYYPEQSYQTGNAYNYSPTSYGQEYGQGYINNYNNRGIVAKDSKIAQYVPTVPVYTDTVIGNEENVKTIQTQQPANHVKEDTSTLSTNSLIFIIAGIALLQSCIIIWFVVRKKYCCRNRSVEEPRSQAVEAQEFEYQELNFPKVIGDIVNRPPHPLPPQKKENIYLHYNTAYDHRIIPPPPRQSRPGLQK